MNKQHQKGFTLLELAIVLVIIGIILGAILKGQELINNAKAKRLLNDMKGLAALQYSFYDRYGRFAGDCDSNGSIDVDYLFADLNSYDNKVKDIDGVIDKGGNFCYEPSDPQPVRDVDQAWAELVKAQLLPPAKHTRDLVKTAYSGAFLFGNYTRQTPFAQFNVIVATQVPCYAAKMIDVAIDNSMDAKQGSIRKIKDGTLDTNASPDWGCANEDDFVDVAYFFDRRPEVSNNSNAGTGGNAGP